MDFLEYFEADNPELGFLKNIFRVNPKLFFFDIFKPTIRALNLDFSNNIFRATNSVMDMDFLKVFYSDTLSFQWDFLKNTFGTTIRAFLRAFCDGHPCKKLAFLKYDFFKNIFGFLRIFLD